MTDSTTNTITIPKALSSLRCATSDGFRALPPWSMFFLELGHFLVLPTLPGNETRIIGVALPTRSLSAALSAVGAVIAAVAGIDDYQSDDDFFEHLCACPKGTNIRFRERDKNGKVRLLEGILLGPKDIPVRSANGQVLERFLQLQLEKSSMSNPAAGGRTMYIPKTRAHDVSLPIEETELTVDNLPVGQKGTIIAPTNDFAKSVFGAKAIAEFERESHMTCLIIGSRSAITADVTEFRFQSDSGSEGSLSDLLRIRRLVGANRPYRSDNFASNSRRPPRFHTDKNRPDLVIFDGALGFLKWRDYFRGSNWLVLLDQAESGFNEALETLNNLYLQRSGSDPNLDSIPSLPDGVEMIYFQERKP